MLWARKVPVSLLGSCNLQQSRLSLPGWSQCLGWPSTVVLAVMAGCVSAAALKELGEPDLSLLSPGGMWHSPRAMQQGRNREESRPEALPH